MLLAVGVAVLAVIWEAEAEVEEAGLADLAEAAGLTGLEAADLAEDLADLAGLADLEIVPRESRDPACFLAVQSL